MGKFESRQQIAEKIYEDGLDLFFLYYTEDTMPDWETREAFIEAFEAIEAFRRLLPDVELDGNEFEEEESDW